MKKTWDVPEEVIGGLDHRASAWELAGWLGHKHVSTVERYVNIARAAEAGP